MNAARPNDPGPQLPLQSALLTGPKKTGVGQEFRTRERTQAFRYAHERPLPGVSRLPCFPVNLTLVAVNGSGGTRTRTVLPNGF